jgi:hypothetical protein
MLNFSIGSQEGIGLIRLHERYAAIEDVFALESLG